MTTNNIVEYLDDFNDDSQLSDSDNESQLSESDNDFENSNNDDIDSNDDDSDNNDDSDNDNSNDIITNFARMTLPTTTSSIKTQLSHKNSATPVIPPKSQNYSYPNNTNNYIAPSVSNTNQSLFNKPKSPSITQLPSRTNIPAQSNKINIPLPTNKFNTSVVNNQTSAILPVTNNENNMRSNKFIDEIISKMDGINITGVTKEPLSFAPDINSIIIQNSDETSDDFNSRKILTFKISTIPNFKLNNYTSVVLAHIIMKKLKYGITYDTNIENVITHLTNILN